MSSREIHAVLREATPLQRIGDVVRNATLQGA
jgi:hypothetical protein